MKKLLGLLLMVLVILAAILVYRAQTVFEDRQVIPLSPDTGVGLDEKGAIDRFSRAIGYQTISYDDRSNFDAPAFLAFHQFLASSYPRVHRQLEKTVISNYSLVYHLPGSDPTLLPVLLMGHMDVVPIDPVTRDQWTHAPFGGVVADGKIWGRGTIDNKLSVITLLEAMELLLTEGRRPQRSIYLAFGHDEEVGGHDGAAQIANWFADQGTRFEFVLDEGGVVTEDIIDTVDNPVAIIGVAEKGWVNLELVVDAPGGHSSQPPNHTAVGILSAAIVRIENSPFPTNIQYLMQTIDAIGNRMSFVNRLFLANTWLFSSLIERQLLADPSDAAGIRTTTAATMISGSPKSNILPTRATAIVNFRILPGETADTVTERIKRLVDDERVKVSMTTNWNPSPLSSTDSASYALIAGTIRGFDENILVAPYMVRGGTDAKYYYPMTGNVYRFIMARVNPETIRYVHGIDEHVAVTDFLQAIRFYYHLMVSAMR